MEEFKAYIDKHSSAHNTGMENLIGVEHVSFYLRLTHLEDYKAIVDGQIDKNNLLFNKPFKETYQKIREFADQLATTEEELYTSNRCCCSFCNRQQNAVKGYIHLKREIRVDCITIVTTENLEAYFNLGSYHQPILVSSYCLRKMADMIYTFVFSLSKAKKGKYLNEIIPNKIKRTAIQEEIIKKSNKEVQSWEE